MQHGIDRAFEVERLADVVLDEMERFVSAEMGDVLRRTSDEVVDADDLPAVGE
jgi:hypothetical protein